MQTGQKTAVFRQQDSIWQAICEEAKHQAEVEPALASFFHATVLNHNTLEDALSFHLANKLANPAISALQVREIIEESIRQSGDKTDCLSEAVRADIAAVYERDSACDSYLLPFLYFKGFHALQAYRVAHCLWQNKRESMAYFLQSHITVTFGVDIHPAAKIGKGIMLDHATGIVIGETAVIGDDVSIMQGVTLGGTGKEAGDRHPKIGKGCLISAGAKILGNITIGDGAKVGAGSVVLNSVPAHTTVVGVPAKAIGTPTSESPALEMNHEIQCDKSNNKG
ncbi:serine O-acetyltransferase [Agarilytica rhodophyticola]|uniref:serine O-acetyltransferase n=1 Tax=Agarilytica rhodophyticola TaxID=1737490 RepID=UPI000B342873|nr:serine O-acetyltransferase [Agarilytica rhodophyticola]